MVGNIKQIHIFSIIPNLFSLIKKKLPKITVINVVNKNNDPVPYNWKQKVVSSEEFSEIKNAEIILGDENLIAQVYRNLPNAKFVQLTWVGVDMLNDQVKKEEKLPMFPIARFDTEIFSQHMAEYTIGQILLKERDWFGARNYQLQSTWAHKDKIAFYKSLRQITVGVLEIAIIGSEVVRILKYFGCNVLCLSRTKTKRENIPSNEVFASAELPLFLEKCDYIVNVLPLTQDTKGLLGKDMLSHAKKKPVFINIGCGDIISEEEILSALDNSWISAAILDVFETEPLPTSSRLWNHPNVTVTPHVAAIYKPKDIVQGFLDNLKRFSEEDSLLNLINWEAGY